MIQNVVVRNCNAVFKYPVIYSVILTLLTCIAAYFYIYLPQETSVESLIIDNDPELRFYEEFKKQFGEDEFIVIGIRHQELFSKEVLSFIDKKTKEMEEIDEVKEVVSLANVENILGTDFDFIVRPLFEEIPQSQKDIEFIKKQALDNELIHANLLSDKNNSTLFLIRTKAHPGDETYDSRLLNKINKTFLDNPLQLDYHLAGWLVTDVNMAGYMAKDMMIFMPMTFGLIILFLFLFLRNIYAVAISLLTVTIALVWTMALLNLSGGAMSPMTSILPPLIMALIVADCVHIFDYFLDLPATASPTENIRNSLEKLSLPCFLTSLTTAFGFASLGLSDIPPIRHLGLAAAGGMMAEFALAVTIIPLCIYALRNRNVALAREKGSFVLIKPLLASWSKRICHSSRFVLLMTAILAVACLLGMKKINIETDLIEYFKKDTPVRTDTRFFDENLRGSTTIELSLQSKQKDYFKNSQNLEMIENIENWVTNFPLVQGVTSINTFLKQMNKAFHNNDPSFHKIPESRNLIAQYLLLYDGDELNYFIDDNYQWARLSFNVNQLSSTESKKLIEEIQKYVQQNYANQGLEIHVTGKTSLVSEIADSIVDSQIKSLSVAFVIIFLCLFIIFKSWKIGFLSLIPNAFPILVNFGIMGYFGIPLNTATAIISAIAIGITVDDTIHYLTHYQTARKEGKNRNESVIAGITGKGSAILGTSIILTGGFLILCFSSFVPTIQFGFLCSITMISAVIGDLVVLPALLVRVRPDTRISL